MAGPLARITSLLPMPAVRGGRTQSRSRGCLRSLLLPARLSFHMAKNWEVRPWLGPSSHPPVLSQQRERVFLHAPARKHMDASLLSPPPHVPFSAHRPARVGWARHGRGSWVGWRGVGRLASCGWLPRRRRLIMLHAHTQHTKQRPVVLHSTHTHTHTHTFTPTTLDREECRDGQRRASAREPSAAPGGCAASGVCCPPCHGELVSTYTCIG